MAYRLLAKAGIAGAVAVTAVTATALVGTSTAWAGNTDPYAPGPSARSYICAHLSQYPKGKTFRTRANNRTIYHYEVRKVTDTPQTTRIDLVAEGTHAVVPVTMTCG